MNDLETIDRLNAAAIGEKIPGWRADGKWVFAEYSGLHFVDAKPFDTEGQLETYLAGREATKSPDQRFQKLEPTVVPGADITHEVRQISNTDDTADGQAEADPQADTIDPDAGGGADAVTSDEPQA